MIEQPNDDLKESPRGVTALGDWLFTHRPERFKRWRKEGCPHHRLTIDDEGEIITCDDCKAQVSAYWALLSCLEQIKETRHSLRVRKEILKEQSEKTLHLRASQVVESAWRSRSMVPTCPHCGRGIKPEDGFGGSMIHRTLDDAARERAKEGGAK